MAEKTLKIPSPVKNGVADVPMIMQYELLECGGVSLCMVLGYYGKWLPSGKVVALCGPCRDGSNAENIARAARHLGMDAETKHISTAEFFETAEYPCIVHWDFVHFLVVEGRKHGKVYINDPRRGSYQVREEDFDRHFTGVCVFLKPSDSFLPEGHRKTLFEFAAQYLKGTREAILFVLITTFLISVLTIADKGMTRVFIDRLLTHKNPEWVRPFLILLCGITFLRIITDALQDLYMVRINGKLSMLGHSEYMWHLFHLPLSFFSQRLAGDITYRKNLNSDIATSLVGTFGPLGVQALMMVLYLWVMISYNPLLAMIGFFSVLINALLGQLIARRRINITRAQMSYLGQMTGTLASGIQMIETIKASGAENGFFERWSGYQAKHIYQSIQNSRLDMYIGILPQLVSVISGCLIQIIGIALIMRGDFTPGALMTFQGILTVFYQPANQLINAGKDFQQLRTNMERIDDVMETEADPLWQEETNDPDAVYHKLSGAVEMHDVSFGYTPLNPPLIEHFDLDLKPGKSVAFVGPSGCGKSTLANLISGLYMPWSGTITFDGKTIPEIDKSVFRTSLAVIDQEIFMFEDTIDNNLRMWSDAVEDFDVILAARDAQIHDEIMKRENGYHHKLKNDGKDFSGGQRQRLEIARSLAQDPTILIMDEATSALDAKTEYDVVRSIRDRGITSIIIAHRLSTIRDCDEIIVLDHGHVVERGSHNELLRRGGVYAKLIESE